MDIYLKATQDPPNYLNKTIVDVETLEGTLKDGSDILNPIIRIQHDGVPTSNYCYIPALGRWYFISDVSVEHNNIFLIHCHVDVLQTFRNDILKASVIARRSSSWYDNFLPDSMAMNRTDVEITYRKLGGFSFVPSAGSYVLQTVGNNPLT